MSSNQKSNCNEAMGEALMRHQRALDARDFAEATEAIGDVFALAAQWCEENPSPDFDLINAASEC